MGRTVLFTVFTIVICAIFIFYATHGLTVFTSEGKRRLEIAENPVTIPNIPLVSSNGEVFNIHDLAGKIVLVDFIFTNCTGICPMMTQNFLAMQKKLKQLSLDEEVILLSISFDLVRDTQSALFEYAKSVGAEPNKWKFSTVKNISRLKELLDVFGIIVIPAPNGQFEHNGAIHLVNKSGKLAKIYDYEDIELILLDLIASIKNQNATAIL